MMIRAQTPPRVVVLGGGYAGLEFVEAMKKEPVDLTLVDRKPYHTEKTKLWKMAVRGEGDPTENLARKVEKAGGRLRLGEVAGIDVESRQVELEQGEAIPYDFLVVAVGSEPGKPENSQAVLTLDQPEDARRIRQTVRSLAATGDGPLPIVVVGGGATGVELAGVVHEVVKQVGRAALDRLELRLLHSGERLVGEMPDDVAAEAHERLVEMGVEVQLGARVASVGEGQVLLQSGQTLPASCVLWATGTRSPGFLADLGPTGRSGRVEVTENLTLPEHPEVFIIGDAALARCAGQVVPPNKRAARQEAEHAADNLQRALEGKPMERFVFRNDKGISHIGPVKLD